MNAYHPPRMLTRPDWTTGLSASEVCCVTCDRTQCTRLRPYARIAAAMRGFGFKPGEGRGDTDRGDLGAATTVG